MACEWQNPLNALVFRLAYLLLTQVRNAALLFWASKPRIGTSVWLLIRGLLHSFNQAHLDHLEARDKCQAAQYRPVMSLDPCLIRDELAPRSFTSRLLKNFGLWSRQRPDALVRPIESLRGCPARFQQVIGRKLKSRSSSLRSRLRRISGLESCLTQDK